MTEALFQPWQTEMLCIAVQVVSIKGGIMAKSEQEKHYERLNKAAVAEKKNQERKEKAERKAEREKEDPDKHNIY